MTELQRMTKVNWDEVLKSITDGLSVKEASEQYNISAARIYKVLNTRYPKVKPERKPMFDKHCYNMIKSELGISKDTINMPNYQLPVQKVADIMLVTKPCVYHWEKKGLVIQRAGRYVYIQVQDLLDFVEANSKPRKEAEL